VRRFFVDLSGINEVRSGVRVSLDAEETRHARTVLRLKDGDTLALTDGQGHVLSGVMAGGDRRSATVEITEVELVTAEVAPPRLHLICAVVKGKRFEAAVEKAVELGVHAITPLVTERGVIEPGRGKHDRWQGLLVTALKQCHRCHLPELRSQAELPTVLAGLDGELFFGAAPGDLVGEKPQDALQLAAQAVRRRMDGQSAPAELRLLVGPEGGWSPVELQMLSAHGAVPLTLGPHVLRTETAAMAGLVALQQLRRAWLS